MRRIQFIEIHEQTWLPSILRHEITDALQFGLNLFKAYAGIAPRLQGALDATDGTTIVDLCSGGGGPWADLSRRLRGKSGSLDVWLTDKYPNIEAAKTIGADSAKNIRYYPTPVDAACVPRDLKGMRTIFTSFHHFSPNEGRAVLQDAVDAREAIAIFEITRRASSTMGFMFAWVVVLCVCTPWIRPFRWSRLFWTFVIPVIPLVLLFDGVVSCLRTYKLEELREIVESLNASEYRWEIKEQAGKMPITTLIGLPVKC